MLFAAKVVLSGHPDCKVFDWTDKFRHFFLEKSKAEDFQIPEDFHHGAQLREILEYFRVPFWVGYKCPVRPAKRLCPVDEKEVLKT